MISVKSAVGTTDPAREYWYDYLTRGPWRERLESEKLIEIVNGVEVEKKMGAWEILLANRLHNVLVAHTHAQGLGESYVEMEFELPAVGNVRKPDVAFVSYQTWPRGRWISPGRGWAIAPELAVEVISPYDLAQAVVTKLQEYFLAGVQSVWQVWPNVEQVHVYTSPTAVRILTRADELTGDPVVPGFRVPIADLFPPSAPSP
jgi:Uma2 family endonuclease